MLKPKKKITRKEIRHDPLLEILYSTRELYNQNKNRILLFTLILVGVVSVILIINRKNISKRVESNAMLARAVSRMGTDVDQALAEFDILLKTFPESEASTTAHFYLGRIYNSIDSLDVAEFNFRTYLELAPDGPLTTATLSYLGSLALQKGDPSLAGDFFEQAGRESLTEYVAGTNLLNGAEAFITAEEYDRAKELILAIPNSTLFKEKVEFLKTKISLLSNS